MLSSCLMSKLKTFWLALTDLTKMTQWYFASINNFQPEIGSASQFIVHPGDRAFTHCWKVIELEAPTKICYSWNDLEYPGDSAVCFQLFELGARTKLIFTQTVLESIRDDIPEFNNESCKVGWDYFLGDQLPAFWVNSKGKNDE